MRLRTACVIACSLMVCVGCARKDRWVLAPSSDGNLKAEKAPAASPAVTSKEGRPLALSKVKLVQKDSVYYVKNLDTKSAVLAVVEIGTPNSKNVQNTTFLVPPDSELQVNATQSEAVTCRIVGATYK